MTSKTSQGEPGGAVSPQLLAVAWGICAADALDLVSLTLYETDDQAADVCEEWNTADDRPPNLYRVVQVQILAVSPAPREQDRTQWHKNELKEFERQRTESEDEIWESVLRAVQRAWPEPHDYGDSPLELIAELIDERDELQRRRDSLAEMLEKRDAIIANRSLLSPPQTPDPPKEQT